MCSIRIIKKVPDLAENFINPAAALLKEKHHGVLITGVQLCTDLCKVSTEALEYFRKVTIHHACQSVIYDMEQASKHPDQCIEFATLFLYCSKLWLYFFVFEQIVHCYNLLILETGLYKSKILIS